MDKRLTQRVANDEQKQRMLTIIGNANKLLKAICECCRDGREKKIAMVKLEECLMWANKAVAHEND